MEGILSVNAHVAGERGRLTPAVEIKGHPMPVVYSLLAATAHAQARDHHRSFELFSAALGFFHFSRKAITFAGSW